MMAGKMPSQNYKGGKMEKGKTKKVEEEKQTTKQPAKKAATKSATKTESAKQTKTAAKPKEVKETKEVVKAEEKPAAKTTKKATTKATEEKTPKAVKTEQPAKVEKPAKAEKVEKTTKKATKNTEKATKTAETPAKTKKSAAKAYDVIQVEGYHKLPLYTYIYDNVKDPKAVVLIVHGMQEHAGRYENFAKFLNANGYIVVANDLRGHGHNCPAEKRGFGERDIYAETVKDETILIEKLHDAYKLPIYLLGHSYGSMVSQALVQSSDLIEKCVLSGTANGSSGIMQLGGTTAGFLSLFKGANSPGGMIENLCIKSYGKGFERGNWLTRDESVFDAYVADEMCGGSFPFGFYHSMLRNMKRINKGINKIGTKKILLLSGDKDPVGSNGKQVKSLCKLYLANNVNARYKLYPDARHEILNETNKEEVYKDILDFFNE